MEKKYGTELAKKYALKFCQEFPRTDFRQRGANLASSNLPNYEVKNGEFILGPSETWPAQIDDLSFAVCEKYPYCRVNYEQMKRILVEEVPTILKRSYTSQREYHSAVREIFDGIIGGVAYARLMEDIQEEMANQGLAQKLFLRKETRWEKAMAEDNVQRRVNYFNSMGLGHLGIIRMLA